MDESGEKLLLFVLLIVVVFSVDIMAVDDKQLSSCLLSVSTCPLILNEDELKVLFL